MAEIIQLFKNKPSPPHPQQPEDYNFRAEWSLACIELKRLRIDPNSTLKHHVYFLELTAAVNVATFLGKDRDASLFFIQAMWDSIIQNKAYTLADIPEEYIGYVWTLDFNRIIRFRALASSRIGANIKQLGESNVDVVRHTFFNNT